MELVGDQLGRRRAGADAQVVAERALLAFGLVGQARHDALDHALLAALGAVDRIAFAGDRHAVQGGERAGSPDGAARRGGGAGADVETLVGHSALLPGESWNVAELGCLGLWKRSTLVQKLLRTSRRLNKPRSGTEKTIGKFHVLLDSRGASGESAAPAAESCACSGAWAIRTRRHAARRWIDFGALSECPNTLGGTAKVAGGNRLP